MGCPAERAATASKKTVSPALESLRDIFSAAEDRPAWFYARNMKTETINTIKQKKTTFLRITPFILNLFYLYFTVFMKEAFFFSSEETEKEKINNSRLGFHEAAGQRPRGGTCLGEALLN